MSVHTPNIEVLYLGSRGGGVINTYEIVESVLQHTRNKYSVLISENNSFRDKYEKLPLSDITVVKTHDLNSIDFLRQTFLSARIFRIIRRLRELQPSGILVTMAHPWIVPIVWGVRRKLKGTSIVYIRHNQKGLEGGNSRISSWVLSKLDDFVISRSTFVLTFSEHVRESTIEEFKLPANKVVNVGFAHKSPCKDWNHSGFLANGQLRLLFFGRLSAYKGLDILISAVETLEADGLPIRITIAGEGEMPAGWRDLAARLGIEFLNRWVSDDELCRLLSETDVVVLPYTRGSQSGPVAIATALGIPVIATDVGGLKEQVVNDVTGVIVERGNAQALAEAIRKISRNPDLLRIYSEGAKSIARERLSWRDKTMKIDALFSATPVANS